MFPQSLNHLLQQHRPVALRRMSVTAIGKQRHTSAKGKELRQRPAYLIRFSLRRNITGVFCSGESSVFWRGSLRILNSSGLVLRTPSPNVEWYRHL